ncbi:hypothetical protein KCP78_10025 [Salmonella enterica subsp. enterica]|nr:hypothetical protein KCP78_10025 [Salmonella enterica subsp. enterica]
MLAALVITHAVVFQRRDGFAVANRVQRNFDVGRGCILLLHQSVRGEDVTPANLGINVAFAFGSASAGRKRHCASSVNSARLPKNSRAALFSLGRAKAVESSRCALTRVLGHTAQGIPSS